ncbi:AfsA-related hotdog domain-containing protein [Streptomyces sp. NPDC048644]|uniref:AfsA-related hotdog domain-containing protein n=1 Tax=Streptomyces sp. NPDC048644 TaxID=3365582 RepID=UPI003710E861
MDFARAVGATTFSELVHALDHGDHDGTGEALAVHAGQGIDDYSVAYLRDAAERRGLKIDVELTGGEAELVGRQHVHKARQDNVLISALERLSAEEFTADLRLHDHNELLVDVQDRVHVQGMVAVEASRQMFLAVIEDHFLTKWPQQRYYIVINEMSTKFGNFLFPVAAKVRLRVDSVDASESTRIPMQVTVTIEQAGRPAATTTVDLAAFAPGVVDGKEIRRAKQAAAFATGTADA